MAEKTMADRIREMSEYLSEDAIALAIKIPVEVVQGVLSGEIPDHVLSDYEPGRSQTVKVVTQKKFVRSKVVGILPTIFPNVLTTSLAVASLSRVKHDVACIDLNEYGYMPLYLGLNVIDSRIPQGMNFIWDDNFDKGCSHPQLENLYVYTSALTPQKHNELNTDFMVSVIGSIGNEFGLTWVELPSSPRLFLKVLNSIDILIFPIMQDISGMHLFKQLWPLVKSYDDRIAIVFNQLPGNLADTECRKVIRTYTDAQILGFAPYEAQISRSAERSEIFVKQYPHSPYTKVINNVLESILPTQKTSKGVSGFFGSLFSKGGV